jgi:hypothetical protein
MIMRSQDVLVISPEIIYPARNWKQKQARSQMPKYYNSPLFRIPNNLNIKANKGIELK